MEENKNKILNVPTLRFKSFEQEWAYSTIGRCSMSLEYGMNAAAVKYDGKHKYIRITDIDEETSAFIPNPLSSPDGEFEQKYLVKENDILFARTGASVGKSYLYNPNDGEVYFAGFLIRARIKPEYNGTFIYYQTKSKKYNRWVKLTSMRSGQPGINSQEYSGYPIAITGKVEQDKIADFLQLIDNRIAVQNKIISKYETLIKGIRHRIFGSICGERQSSLGSFLEEYSEKNVANNLQSVAVGKYGIRKREEIYSKELSADYSKNKVIRKNTLIIGMGSTQIDIGILTTDDCYCVSPAYTTYRIKGVNSFYLQEYLIELNPLLSVRYMITSARQGKAVNKEDLMKHLMTVHSENEQKEICQCFENLYSRLQIEKEMLSALQKQKAFLLQSMFI